jgi:arabinofuranosyltransferase
MRQAQVNPAMNGIATADLALSVKIERLFRPLIVIAILMAIVWTLLAFSFTVDDAFISFRNGLSLVTHHVWNWNSSGTREEAYTSASYTLLAVLPIALGIPVVLFMKLVGLACWTMLLYRVWTVTPSRFAAVLGILVLTLSPVIWIHVYSCLETPLYCLLIVEMALAASKSETNPLRVYALFMLLPLTRPEGFVFGCVGVLLYWAARRKAGLDRKLGWFAVALAIGLAYFAWRASYFHHLLPNPFYVKVAHQSLRDSAFRLAENLATYKGYIVAVLLAAVLSRRIISKAFAWSALALLIILFAPHDMAMNYADRFYVQLALPTVLIFLMLEEAMLVSRLATLTAALFIFAFPPHEILERLKYPANIARAHEDIGHRLAPFAANHILLAADVGMIPYYSGWFTYDYLGLATNSIAQHGVSVESLTAMHPDLIIVYSADRGPGLLDGKSWVGGTEQTGHAVVQYINSTQAFDYAGSSKSNGFYLVSFLRKGTPDHDAIMKTLAENEQTSQVNASLKDVLLQRPFPASK